MVEIREGYKNVRGQQLRFHLDNTYNMLKAENPNFDFIGIELDAFIQLIPENSDIAGTLKEKLIELDKTYSSIKSKIMERYKKGGYLEKTDSITVKIQNRHIHLMKKYYICNNIYERYRLYEDDSNVDYEI